MSARVAFSCDVVATEVLLGSQGVVRRAAKRQIREVVLSTFPKRLHVMNLEAMRFSTALPTLIDVSAPSPIALEDGSSFGCRNVSAALARARVTFVCRGVF